MRIAFLSCQFPSEKDATGGVGTYVMNIAKSLQALGHEPEVFVISRKGRGKVVCDGIRVERVPMRVTKLDNKTMKIGARILRSWWPPLRDAIGAWRLAGALERRHRKEPFDIIQSSNFGLTGFFIRRRPRRIHMVRISTSRVLYGREGDNGKEPGAFAERLDVRTLRRADLCYAPSRLLAEYFRNKYDIPVHVLRPPLRLSQTPSGSLPFSLPDRFFVHFGNICKRKGSDIVAEALILAWKEEPDLRMVWAGRKGEPILESYEPQWGECAQQVLWLGPLPRAQLYAVVARADAAVLPSRVDNLPNTVLESLALGVPVIGADGASIDEVVESGRNGELVPIGDHEALARAMVRAWRREVAWLGKGFQRPQILDIMTPETAATRLIEFATSPARGRRHRPKPDAEQPDQRDG